MRKAERRRENESKKEKKRGGEERGAERKIKERRGERSLNIHAADFENRGKAMSQGIQSVSRSWKRQGNLEPFKGMLTS